MPHDLPQGYTTGCSRLGKGKPTMRTLVLFLPALGCVGGMALCMRLMSRSHGDTSQAGPGPHRLGESEISDLRRELERLRGEAQSST